jgi:hypothetical protein
MVLHEAYIKEQIQKLEDLIKKHGANPEADGMLHALVWVINPRTIPVPSAYAEMLYGIGDPNATYLPVAGTTGVGQVADSDPDSTKETSDPDRRGPEGQGNGDVRAGGEVRGLDNP